MTLSTTGSIPVAPAPSGQGLGIRDAFGVEIRSGDRVRVLAWGWSVRLLDTGRTMTALGSTRAGNLIHDCDEVANGRAVRPTLVGVMRRDGFDGYEGNLP